MDEYVAKQIERLVQLENDVNLLNFQIDNPESPHPTPYFEHIQFISNKIKRLQDRIKELKEEVYMSNRG